MPSLNEIQDQIRNIEGANSFFSRKEVKELPKVLSEGERIEMLVTGRYEGRFGVLVATDRRAVFLDKGLLTSVRVESFPYDKISSVQYETSWGMGKLRIYASGNKAEVDWIPTKLTQRLADVLNLHVSGGGKHDQKSAPSADDAISKLERLAALRERGALTEDEFQEQKRRLLES